MALTLNSSPEAVNLSRNPVVYDYSTNNSLSNAGQISRHTWQFSSIPNVGDDARLQWLDGAVDLDFEFVTTPNNSGLQLPVGVGTVISYLTNVLIPALKRNYYLNRDYDISQSGDRIFLDAKVKSPAYDILFTSGNIGYTFTVTQAGVAPVERPNFRLLLSILYRYRGASNWESTEWERVPINNKVAFDISPILRSLNKMILPATNLVTVLDINGQMCEFQVAAAEAFGSPVAVQQLTNQGLVYALNGGYSEKDRLENSFYADHSPQFLTWRTIQKIDINQPAFLSFLNTTIYTNFWVVVKLFGRSGSLGERVALTFSANEFDLKLIPAHYDFAVLGQTLDEPVLYYEIQIQRASTTQVISTKIRFNVRQENSLDMVFLAYKNGFGAFETVSFTGSKEVSTLIEAFVAQTKLSYDTPYNESGLSTYQTKKNDIIRVRSGFLTSDEIYRLQDLLISELRYLIIGSEYIPVHIEDFNEIPNYQTKVTATYTLELVLKLIPEYNFSYAGNRIK
tara:strand:- start:2467 stop:3996 length:1530 start_codon:yes stop_codon:yes gene_type:complete